MPANSGTSSMMWPMPTESTTVAPGHPHLDEPFQHFLQLVRRVQNDEQELHQIFASSCVNAVTMSSTVEDATIFSMNDVLLMSRAIRASAFR